MAHSEPRDTDDTALTEALRSIMYPRARRWLWLTVALLVLLALGAWVASRTVLSALWQ